jgi:hypothetical protein
MNSQTIDQACNKLESLLYKLPPIQQKQEMEEMYWEIQQTDLMIDSIRTDHPMAFCMDLAQALKNTDKSSLVFLMEETIEDAEEPMDLLMSMLV